MIYDRHREGWVCLNNKSVVILLCTGSKKYILPIIFWSHWTKLGRIGVLIRDSLSRRYPNHWYQSWVKARYWKPKIVVTRILISSLTGICPNTNMLTRILIRVRTFFSLNTPISKLFSNSDTLSSYSPKFALRSFIQVFLKIIQHKLNCSFQNAY